jgi:Lantibiotic dehydratase, N terminus
MFWSCPDKETLSRALTSTTFSRPNFHFGFFAADFIAHTTVRLFDAIPELANFVAPQRGHPKWKKTSPADAEVYIDEATGDVCVGRIDNHEHLGSFARAWVIPLGFHPFQFGMAPHTPRLRCGKVIVQRRSWTVKAHDLIPGNYTGVSNQLVVAVEKLRAERNLPRFIYIRPTEQALRRSGAEGRDKDTKPVFVDLESYLFLEIFHRWLIKAGEIEVTEMLPDSEHLFWKESNGRHSFELRTLIVPRS